VATEVHQFSATIPAGTSIDDLFIQPLEIANYEIESIDIEVPPGPNGNVGFYLALDDQQWLPWEMGEFIIWNDRTENWPLDDQIVNGTWNLYGYNNGNYDHTVTVRFHVSPIPSDSATVAPSITIVTTPLASASAVL
jgi:hypothetical protein